MRPVLMRSGVIFSPDASYHGSFSSAVDFFGGLDELTCLRFCTNPSERVYSQSGPVFLYHFPSEFFGF
jgi:hypothetical protein